MLSKLLHSRNNLFRDFSKASRSDHLPRHLKRIDISRKLGGIIKSKPKSRRPDLTGVDNPHLFFHNGVDNKSQRSLSKLRQKVKKDEIDLEVTDYDKILQDIMNPNPINRNSEKVFLRIGQLEEQHPQLKEEWKPIVEALLQGLLNGNFSKYKVRGLSKIVTYAMKYTQMNELQFQMIYNYATGIILNLAYQNKSISSFSELKEREYLILLERLHFIYQTQFEGAKHIDDLVDIQLQKIFKKFENICGEFLVDEHFVKFLNITSQTKLKVSMGEIYKCELESRFDKNKDNLSLLVGSVEIVARFSQIFEEKTIYKLVNLALSALQNSKTPETYFTIRFSSALSKIKQVKEDPKINKRLIAQIEKAMNAGIKFDAFTFGQIVNFYIIATYLNIQNLNIEKLNKYIKLLIENKKLNTFMVVEAIKIREQDLSEILIEKAVKNIIEENLSAEDLKSMKEIFASFKEEKNIQMIVGIDSLINEKIEKLQQQQIPKFYQFKQMMDFGSKINFLVSDLCKTINRIKSCGSKEQIDCLVEFLIEKCQKLDQKTKDFTLILKNEINSLRANYQDQVKILEGKLTRSTNLCQLLISQNQKMQLNLNSYISEKKEKVTQDIHRIMDLFSFSHSIKLSNQQRPSSVLSSIKKNSNIIDSAKKSNNSNITKEEENQFFNLINLQENEKTKVKKYPLSSSKKRSSKSRHSNNKSSYFDIPDFTIDQSSYNLNIALSSRLVDDGLNAYFRDDSKLQDVDIYDILDARSMPISLKSLSQSSKQINLKQIKL